MVHNSMYDFSVSGIYRIPWYEGQDCCYKDLQITPANRKTLKSS